MNTPSQSRAILLLGSMLIVAAPCAMAADPVPAPAAAPPCEACHGAHGEGMEAAHVPRIAGQSADYLRKQLDDYASGARDNPIMANFAKTLSGQQRAKFAARYAAMTAPHVPTAQTASAAQLARGHQLAYQGDETRRVQSCNACHGPDGIGVAHAAPYLAGQSAEYLASKLKAFQEGTRKKRCRRTDAIGGAAVSGYFASVHFNASAH